MLEITCSGSPYEIGFQHGTQAKAQVSGSIDFYKGLFERTARFDWPRVRSVAKDFETRIAAKWPQYLEEMQGVADGAGVDMLDVVALNVRTEITFGNFVDPDVRLMDGCTAMAWQTPSHSFLAQNWDWTVDQKPNLVVLDIVQQQNKPRAKFVTEAGIIGKIGFNDAGVGVTLNAIRALGMDASRLPVHLALRAVLDSPSVASAQETLQANGVAASCHLTISDTQTNVGAECSAKDILFLQADADQKLFHSNHFLEAHPGVTDSQWIKDSFPRVLRIKQLVSRVPEESASVERLAEVFKDEEGAPGAINRQTTSESGTGTLFNIVMDLKAKRARVVLGRPTEPDETFELSL